MKRSTYTRAELDFVLDHIARQGAEWIDTADGSLIRNLAGESERDYNLYLLYGILERMNVARTIDAELWVDGVGYTRVTRIRITRIRITDKHLREITAGRVQADGQIAIF